jgi:hypothetical protein
MKSSLLLIGMGFIPIFASSQLLIKHDTVWKFNFPADNLAHGITDTILNQGSNSQAVTWTRGAAVLPMGWTCSWIDDPVGSYGCADTNVHTATVHPNQPGVWWVNMKAAPGANNGPASITINTNVGNMVYMFQLGPNGIPTSFLSDLLVYPSPAENKLFIQGDLSSVTKYSILNAVGQVVWRQNHPAKSPIGIDVTHFLYGLYYVKLEDDQGQYVVRKWTK